MKLDRNLSSEQSGLLERLRSQVPQFVQRMEEQQEYSLHDYSLDLLTYEPATEHKERAKYILRYINPECSSDANWQEFRVKLEKSPVVCTANHGGMLMHPIFLSSNFALAIGQRGSSQNYVPILSNGNIPLNNPSLPSCLMFSNRNPQGESCSLNLFSHRERNQLVHILPGVISQDGRNRDFADLLNEVRKMESAGLISWQGAAVVFKIIDDFKNDRGFTKRLFFHDQARFFNESVWPRLTHFPAPKLSESSYEFVVINWICRKLIEEPQNPVSKVILDKEWRTCYIQSFTSSFQSAPSAVCTPLFWGIADDGTRISLQLENDELVGEGIRIALQPDALHSAMIARRLIPSTILILVVVALYCGIKVCGGFMQICYLERIKSAWLKMLTDLREDAEAELARLVPINGLSAGPLFFFAQHDSWISPATTVDLLIRPLTASFLEAIAMRPVIDYFLPSLAEVHNIVSRTPMSKLETISYVDRTVKLLNLPVVN